MILEKQIEIILDGCDISLLAQLTMSARAFLVTLRPSFICLSVCSTIFQNLSFYDFLVNCFILS